MGERKTLQPKRDCLWQCMILPAVVFLLLMCSTAEAQRLYFQGIHQPWHLYMSCKFVDLLVCHVLAPSLLQACLHFCGYRPYDSFFVLVFSVRVQPAKLASWKHSSFVPT